MNSERMYSIQSFGKSLLCVCDYLNLAIASVPQTELEGESANKVLLLILLWQLDFSFSSPGSGDDSEGTGQGAWNSGYQTCTSTILQSLVFNWDLISPKPTSIHNWRVISSSESSVRHSTLTSTRLCSKCLWLREKNPTHSAKSSRLDTCSKSVCCVLVRRVCIWRRNKGEKRKEKEMLLEGFVWV